MRPVKTRSGAARGLLSLVALLAALRPAPALADELADEVDTDEAIYAVQDRLLLKGHEFNVSLGVLPLDSLYKGVTLGFGYAYHFNSLIGWQIAHLRYSFNANTSTAGELSNKYGVEPSRVSSPVEILLDSSVFIKALSGKAVLGRRRLVGGELDFIVGPAAAVPSSQQVMFGVNVGLGLRAYLSRYFSARLEVRQYELVQVSSARVNHVLDISLGASLNLR